MLQYLSVWELSTENHLKFQDGRFLSILAPDEVKLWTNWSIRGTQHLINAQRDPGCVSTLHARNNILIFWKLHQDLAPAALRICSYESQNVRDQGAILNQHGRNPLYKAETEKVRKTFSENIFFTKKPFSFDGGDETVQRVFVDQTSSLLICRLVHYPRLHNISRSPHDGSDQTEGYQCEGGRWSLVILTPHMPRTWCVSECCPPGWCCPGCSSWHCRRWRDHRGSPGQLARHLASSLATVPSLLPAGELSWQLLLIDQSVSQFLLPSLTSQHPNYRELGEVCQEVVFFPPSVSESLWGPWETPSVAQYLQGHWVNIILLHLLLSSLPPAIIPAKTFFHIGNPFLSFLVSLFLISSYADIRNPAKRLMLIN